MLNFRDFIRVFTITTDHHLNVSTRAFVDTYDIDTSQVPTSSDTCQSQNKKRFFDSLRLLRRQGPRL